MSVPSIFETVLAPSVGSVALHLTLPVLCLSNITVTCGVSLERMDASNCAIDLLETAYSRIYRRKIRRSG